MPEINILDLHEEILEKILLFASDVKIKELTKVCTKFNDVIGSSAKLMNKFIVKWKEVKFENVKPLLASKRKYRNIEIEQIGLTQDLICFLNNNSSTLTELSLNNSAFSIYECELIFNIIAENIVDLKLYIVHIWGEKETIPINFPKMESLYLNSIRSDKMTQIFNFFMGANTELIIYREIRSLNEQELTAFSKMITSFSKLTAMDIGICELQLFENDFLIKNVNFKLKVFNLIMIHLLYGRPDEFLNRRYVNLLNFIKSHRKTLKEMTVTNLPVTSDVIECLSDLECLVNLDLHSYPLHHINRSSKPNTSIKNLVLILEISRSNSVCEIVSSITNVYCLYIFYGSFTFDIALTIVNKMKNFKKIKFEGLTQIFPMTMPSVIGMEFTNIVSLESIIRVILVNRQLKSIKIPRILQHHPKFDVAMDGLNLEKLEFY